MSASIMPIKKPDEMVVETPSLHIFDLPEPQLKHLLERRARNRITFLSIVKHALTEGVDYCNLPAKGKKALPTLMKGGAEVVCQILGLTPRIMIAQSDDTSITMCCELLNEQQQVVSMGYGSRIYSLDASNGGRNKTTKMTTKSAYLDAVIRAGALSSLFTMDLEDQIESKPLELISPSQYDTLMNALSAHQVNTDRFTNWVSKVCESKQLPPIQQLSHMPASLFSGVLAKIPSFASAN